jgi:DNA-binding transcriptional regulator YiaG
VVILEENLVKQVCKEYNLTVNQLSEKLEIPKGTIGRWSSTQKIPKTAEIALSLMLENKKLKDKLTNVNDFKESLKGFIFDSKI